MLKPELKAVQKWLHSIRRTELATYNLERAIADLDSKIDNPPSYLVSGVANYSPCEVIAHGEQSGKGERFAEWMEQAKGRREFLQDKLHDHRRKVERYTNALQSMRADEKWGALGADIVENKYYRHIKPDRAIYTMFLFVTEETFYRVHRRALQYFYDVLPDVFLEENKK